MAFVGLDQVWVGPPGEAMALDVSSLKDQTVVPGEVVRFAGGRLRWVGQAGSQLVLSGSAGMMHRDTWRTLTGWQGRQVLWRDPTGRKVYGMLTVTASELVTVGDWLDVDWEFRETSASEAV